MLLEPTLNSGVRVVERLAGHLVLEPLDTRHPIDLPWKIDGLRSRFPPATQTTAPRHPG